MLDENQDPEEMLSSSHTLEFHLMSGTKETLPDKQQQPQAETGKEGGERTMIVDETQDPDQLHSSSHSHNNETNETLSDNQQQPQAETSQKGGALTGNGEDGMIEDENQDPDQALSSSYSSEFHLNGEGKETLPDKQRQRGGTQLLPGLL